MKVWSVAFGLVAGAALAEECGTVSVFFSGPETAGIYDARIGAVDGKSTLLDVTEHRLTPGTHELKVYELIDAPELRVDARHRGYGKILNVNVEKDKVYYVGAKFDFRKPFDRDEFWEPVIWKVDDRPCEP